MTPSTSSLRPTRIRSSGSSTRSRPAGRVSASSSPRCPRFRFLRFTTCGGSRTARSRSSSAAHIASMPNACSASHLATGLRGVGGRRARGDGDRRRGPPPARGDPAAHSRGAPSRRARARGRAWYPDSTDGELDRVAALVDSYCASELAQRLAGLPGAQPERPFVFEHDGVLIRGRLDVMWQDGERALVVDYKSNALEGRDPGEIVEGEYGLQRLVYALVCLRAGATHVEVAYQFLEAPNDVVSTSFGLDDVELEVELSAAIARIRMRRLPADTERVRLRGLPRARPRVCRAAASHRGSLGMRVAALYDIHGNLAALEAVLEEVGSETVDAIVVGGDVLWGPFQSTCLAELEACRRALRRGQLRTGSARCGRGRARAGAVSSSRQKRCAFVAAWPATLQLDVDGLGHALFCHATPRSDDDNLTRLTPDDDVARRCSGVDADIVVCGHTHVQSTAGCRAARGSSTPAASACRIEGERGAFWALLGSDVEFRRTEYDIEAAVAALAAPGVPARGDLVEYAARPPDPAESRRRSSSAAACLVATSGGAASRPRPPARAHRADRRTARGRARGRGDRAPLPLGPRAPRLGDALRADDGRERQQGHPGAVREVPRARGLPRRARRGARARHLRDRLLPAEGEGDPRDDAHAHRGVRRRGSAATRRSWSGCPASRERPRTSSPPSSATRRASWSTRTSGGSRSGSG